MKKKSSKAYRRHSKKSGYRLDTGYSFSARIEFTAPPADEVTAWADRIADEIKKRLVSPMTRDELQRVLLNGDIELPRPIIKWKWLKR